MTAVPLTRGPRYVFVTDGRTAPHTPRFAWRLDAANHRPLGRSAGTFDSVGDCRRRLAELRVSHTALTTAVSFDLASGVWTWLVSRSGSVVAVSVRTYARRFDCHRAIGHFLGAVVDADPKAGSVRVVSSVAMDRHATSSPSDAAVVVS